MLRDARTPRAPVPRTSRNMKTTGDESMRGMKRTRFYWLLCLEFPRGIRDVLCSVVITSFVTRLSLTILANPTRVSAWQARSRMHLSLSLRFSLDYVRPPLARIWLTVLSFRMAVTIYFCARVSLSPRFSPVHL